MLLRVAELDGRIHESCPRATALVVAALTVTALTLCPSAASATGITSTEGATPMIKAGGEGHVVFDNPVGKIECVSSFDAKVESHGESTTAGASMSSLSFTNCTSSWHVTVVSPGSLSIHAIGAGPSGTVTSSGATIEATAFGITCRYATNNTHVGTLTGTYVTGEEATLDLQAAIPFHSGSILCGSGTAAWTGSYKVSSPGVLDVDPGSGGEAAGLLIEPEPVAFTGEGDEQIAEIINPGKTTLEDIEILVTIEPGFKGQKICHGLTLEEKESCLEVVKCNKKGIGHISARTIKPVYAAATARLECP